MRQWPHSPSRLVQSEGTYIVTSGTLHKQHFFRGDRIDLLHDSLLDCAEEFGWHLEAWAVFSNHYHFVGRSADGGTNLDKFTGKLHANTARAINKLDGSAGRKVWFSYRQTKLTYERSYLARLNYVMQNPLKHGLVQDARLYRWCSAAWFEQRAEAAWRDTVWSFPTDEVNVPDDF